MRRILFGLAVLAVAAPVAFAGSGSGPFLKGADAYWLYRPHGKPKAVVVFLHGLDQSELRPANHQPWIDHLVKQGDAVIYPRYENNPGGRAALVHTLIAVHAALVRLNPPNVRLVVVGYSRGGRLALEWASIAWRIHVAPAAVMSIFPSQLNPQLEEIVDFTNLPHAARVLLLAGQEDSPKGVQELLGRLADSKFPAAHVETDVVKNRGTFHADHFSALQFGPDAQREFWARFDRLVRQVS